MERVYVKSKMNILKLALSIVLLIIAGVSGFMIRNNTDSSALTYLGFDFTLNAEMVRILAWIAMLSCPIGIFIMIQKYRNPIDLSFDESGLTFFDPKIDLVLWEDIVSILKAFDKKEWGLNSLFSFSKVYPVRFIVKDSEKYLGKKASRKDGNFEIIYHVINTKYSTNALIELLEAYQEKAKK